MANLPEKNVVLVDKITNVPTDSNLFINANGEFKQASVNDVVNSSTVVSTAVETAINTAVQDSIDSNFKQTSGSPILLTDSADGTLIDFKGKGRSTQNGTPTPDSPIAIKSVADGGYFDGELLQGYYSSTGAFASTGNYVCTKNKIPCVAGDEIKLKYKESASTLSIMFFDENGAVVTFENFSNVSEAIKTAPTNATSFTFTIGNTAITPQTAKPITVTINGKYALIVKSKGKNLWEFGDQSFTSNSGTIYKMLKAGTYTLSALVTSSGTNTTLSTVYFNNGVKDIKGIPLQRNVRSSYTFTLDEDITKIILYAETDYSNSSGDTATWSDIQIEEGTTATPYEPYKETVTYIPLNEPLRSSLDGTITDEVSLTDVTRRFTEVVFDGSDDEEWTFSQIVNNYGYFYISTNGGKVYKEYKQPMILCDSFTVLKGISQYENPTQDCILSNNILSGISKLCVITQKATDLSTWKTWLQANPITAQYELAEPTTETIEPVDIVTYDNVTYLTASDNADMEIEYPTTKVAGIASIGYSKGRKAEYETEQLKKQLLEIQATIVNTL